MQAKEIKVMQDAIRALHGCESDDLGKLTYVKEMFRVQVAWEGWVRHFLLVDHPEAKRAYAWSYQEGNETKTVTVLEIPPVDSPQSAVKVAIAAKARG